MRATELRYSRRQHTTFVDGEPERREDALRLLSAPDVLVVDDGAQVRAVDFTRARVLRVDRAERTWSEASLFALVGGLESGLYSALHVIEVAAAGGAALGQPWQAAAIYSLTVEQAGAPPEPERAVVGDEVVWTIDGLEVARARASTTELPRAESTRLWAHAITTHPRIRAALVDEGRVPARLWHRTHCKLLDREETLELDSVAQVELEPDALTDGCEPAEPFDDVHALALSRFDQPTLAFRHLDAARRLFTEKRDVEAALAVFAHTLVSADTAGCPELLREISARARRWSAVRKMIDAVMQAQASMGDVDFTHARLKTFDKVRRKAGDYAYILDVFAGEGLYEIDDIPGAMARLGAALRHDPQLSAAWVSMGRVYARKLEFDVAWDCWDQALAQCPRHPVMGDVHAHRRRLTELHPQFF